MAVLLETSIGDLVIDLYTEDSPNFASTFIKLCKIKYYHGCLLFNVQPNLCMQTGDPTGTGRTRMLPRPIENMVSSKVIRPRLRRAEDDRVGLVILIDYGPQFIITLRGEDLDTFLNQDDNSNIKYNVIGEVAEGQEVLEKVNNLYCDDDGRPFQDIRIRHTSLLDDPFEDPVGLDTLMPPSSPTHEYPPEEKIKRRIRYEDDLEQGTDAKTQQELEESIRKNEAKSRAIVLEMTGDLPDAEVKPPAEVLFICMSPPSLEELD